MILSVRTDLVYEKKIDKNLTGIKNEYLNNDGCETVKTVIESDEASKTIGKPKGTYYTIRFDRLDRLSDVTPIKEALKKSLEDMLPKNGTVLIIGLGNRDITPDALGPLVADGIFATRHIGNDLMENLGLKGLRSVACLVPGVLGKTGIESAHFGELITAGIKPCAVIAIDALASAKCENICRTIQLSDTGINPGAGVNNSRKELSLKTVGIPVIAIGMPTVTDAQGYNGNNEFMVTPKEIDLLIKKGADLISRSINELLQKSLDSDTLNSLT